MSDLTPFQHDDGVIAGGHLVPGAAALRERAGARVGALDPRYTLDRGMINVSEVLGRLVCSCTTRVLVHHSCARVSIVQTPHPECS